jgi:hypothetical protein
MRPASGLAGLGQHSANRLDELEKLRRSDDRGTRAESFPYWKIAIAAFVWGVGVAIMIAFITRGAPWWDMFALWAFIAIATFCISLGC